MRERLDCAVLLTTETASWANPDHLAGHKGRLQVLPLCPDIDTHESYASTILAANVMQLRRFDACLLPVAPQNLAWARMTLSAARTTLRTPVVTLCRDLKACALHDLYLLGVADFVRVPVCVEELRVRIERLLDKQRRPAPGAAASGVGTTAPQPAVAALYPATQQLASSLPAVAEPSSDYAIISAGMTARHMCDTILERTGTELEAFAIASASRYATSAESFRRAKSQVVERFERAYITAALSRHSGNIAMAARAAQKHRRAFWALMRKHDIDAGSFRRPPAR
ncbi:hypothetical protein GSY71_16920 [Pusillimonas sp. TS35]|uniref:helix-turn-helix domain-containing protein n=1 Tax=Paracandidimonas lactea TaxID=2895524 RepID=UPI0013685D6C|nr:helix-turn-helix domain-containing protein [Paracandidimonas lactea]MYN14824.1 hypothetical protein [Pusillimonas sp. TS35]